MWKNIRKGRSVKDGGQAKLQRQYAKRRKPGKKLTLRLKSRYHMNHPEIWRDMEADVYIRLR